ncbi:MAG: HWE histidine kinase domain-containing protein [Pseudomonadota bacterium]|jgi:PAS domain S-box-containing protein
MSVIPSAVFDAQRLALLKSFDILDTGPEIGFDDVVMLARQICDTPIALVSLVAANRQWFKAVSGLDVCETPIDQSVCAHSLQRAETLNIPDLTKDDRTRNNTLVTGEPFIRFYAGAPLVTSSGLAIGTVCVIDTVPRPGGLNPAQLAALEALARQVMSQLQLRRAKLDAEMTSAELEASETRLRLASEAGQIGSFEIDVAANEMTVTEQFCRVYGLPFNKSLKPEIVEALVLAEDRSIISTRDRRADPALPLAVEYRIRKADSGQIVWISRRAQLTFDADGNPVRMFGTVHDITDRKLAEQQLRHLNEELGHRIKNSMALVSAIASQTLRGASDRDAVHAFGQRIGALSRAHDVLLQQSWSSASMRDVIEGALAVHGDAGRFVVSGPEVRLEPKTALSLSLLFHELATNAVKYGALSVPEGVVEVHWSKSESDLILSWVEKHGPPAVTPERAGLGTRLINVGLGGTSAVIKSYAQSGFSAEFRAPLTLIEHNAA